MTSDPRKGYLDQQPGNPPRHFEDGLRVYRKPHLEVMGYRHGLSIDPRYDRVTIEATKPDARFILRLTIGFATEQEAGTPIAKLDDVCINALTVRQNLAATKIWLAECDEYGDGLREVGNLVGTEVVPVQMVADGLWGATYEVDVDCKAVRARVDFASPFILGRFYAVAKWASLGEVSEADWMRATERMDINASPRGANAPWVQIGPA